MNDEVKARWGNTDAYAEYSEKTKAYSKDKWSEANEGLLQIFKEFATTKSNGLAPDSAEVQSLVLKLQSHISTYYYNCTREILAGLGQMYVVDERFKANIDKNGEGTAEFVSKAIDFFVNCDII